MPNSDRAKIRLVRKRPAVVVALLVVVAALWTVVGVTTQDEGSPLLHAGNRTYTLEVAVDATQHAKGLGGRESLPHDAGMLFVFDMPGAYCFWMKDMQFAIDIIWLDDTYKVVHLEQNVSPKTHPSSFCPTQQARYVLELNAGEAKRSGISQGKTLDIRHVR